MTDRDDDPELDELARALRAVTADAPPATVASTRARLVASARRRAAPSWALAAAAGLAIVLGGSTVWALFTGRIPLGSSEAPARPVEVEPPRAVAPAHAGSRRRAAPETPPVIAPAPVPEPSAREVEAPPPPRVVERRPARALERPAIDPAERRAYDAAHALHFDEGDWPAAIGAWDAYLASYPRGRFGLEARYNRALALVHAGRTAEAREALAPFAEGRFGAYRRTEASALLDALAPEPPR